MAKARSIVLIEDEAHQRELLRQHFDTWSGDKDRKGTVSILPSVESGKKAYRSIEEFILSDEGKNVDADYIIVADLYLEKDTNVVTPWTSFSQLMIDFYRSPLDNSIVCGRLGILQLLRRRFVNAHIEVFSYYPKYFSGSIGISGIRKLFQAVSGKASIIKAVAESINNGGDTHIRDIARNNNLEINDSKGWEVYIQRIALLEAIDARFSGIFGRDHNNLTVSCAKSDKDGRFLRESHTRLTDKIAGILSGDNNQSEGMLL